MKLIDAIENLLKADVKTVTLSRRQVTMLVALAKVKPRKTDATTGRLRRAMYRAEMSALHIAKKLNEHRTRTP